MGIADGVIELLDPAHRASVRREDVYFPFASGRFAYDCASCGSQCCRGHSYLVTVGPELDTQLSMRRGLPLFLEPSGQADGRQYRVSNCVPGCFFLDGDGGCAIHRTRGYAAKPETCRLFPFNYIRRIGTHLIVAPHPWLCPLRIVAGAPDRAESEHGALFEAMRSGGITARVPSCSTEDRDANQVIAHERRMVDLSDAYVERWDVRAFLGAMAGADDATAAWPDTTSAFDRIAGHAAALLDLPVASGVEQSPDLARVLVAASPFIRAQLTFRGLSEDRDGWCRIDPARRAHALFVLYLFAESARVAGTTPVTFQTVSKLFRDMRPLIVLVANLDRAMAWTATSSMPLPVLRDESQQRAFVRLAKALMAHEQRRHPTSVGELLLEHAPRPIGHRITFIKELARVLVAELAPVDAEPRAAAGPSVKTRVRQWMFRSLSESVLVAAYSRARGAQRLRKS